MNMKRAEWVKQAVVAGSEFHAMKATPWKHNLINGFATLWLAVLFWGAVSLGLVLHPAIYIPVAGLLVGVCFFGVNVLIIHECSHNMFIRSSDRDTQKNWNHRIGVAAGWPFFTAYELHWEKGHTIHHLRPCEDDDPQDKDPITGKPLYMEYLKLATIPLYPVSKNPSSQYDGKALRMAKGVLAWAPAMALMVFIGGWAAVGVWVVGFNVVMMLNMTKKAQEHGCGLKYEPERMLRSRTYLYPLSFLFSPFNINYHFEHHANFNVPWYRLREYHQTLKGVMPQELQPYYFHHEFMLQLSGKKPLPPDELRSLMVG